MRREPGSKWAGSVLRVKRTGYRYSCNIRETPYTPGQYLWLAPHAVATMLEQSSSAAVRIYPSLRDAQHATLPLDQIAEQNGT